MMPTPRDPQGPLQRLEGGKTTRAYQHGQVVFSQGDAADSVFYVERGRVRLSVVSPQGREAVIGVVRRGSFFGEGCLAGQKLRRSTARSVRTSAVLRLDRRAMVAVLRRDPQFAELFIGCLLSRNLRIEENLVAQVLDSSEKRLARVLLLLAEFGKQPMSEGIAPRTSRKTLASMVGITRARVAHLMGRFRRMGFIHYDRGLRVSSSLLTVLLCD